MPDGFVLRGFSVGLGCFGRGGVKGSAKSVERDEYGTAEWSQEFIIWIICV